MSTRHHTAIASGAAASAATINTPLGALDAAMTPDVTGYASSANIATTVTTAGTYYAVTGEEVSFTPAYDGQVFLVSAVMGYCYTGTAGTATYNLRITDGASATIVDAHIIGRSTATTSAAGACISGLRTWTAAAGDVGVTRKAKLYVTHTVNGSVVNVTQSSLQAITW